MRKTSQDGGDTTSIMSSVENEIKKPTAAVIKNKRNSLKRKVQTLSHESDDAVSEPLLQKEKEIEKPEAVNQSAKFSMLKSKTDSVHVRDNEKDKLLPDNKAKTSGLQEVPHSSSKKDNIVFKPQPNTTAPLHNHMNTNVFSSIDTTKFVTAPKNQILVEIDGCKQIGYNPSPLIFTTAKIHTDSKTKQMEPVQVTAVPILSTTEIAKTGKTSSGISIAQPVPGTSDIKLTDKSLKNSVAPSTTFEAGTSNKYNVPKTTSGNKFENTLADRSVIVSNTVLKDSTKTVAIDTKVSKLDTIKSENKLSEPFDSDNIKESLKSDYLAKSFQSPLVQNKDVKTVNTMNVSKTSMIETLNDNIPGISRKPEIVPPANKFDKTTIGQKDTYKCQGGKIDENANASSINVVVSLQQSNVLSAQNLPAGSKIYPVTVSKDNVSKDTASSTSNKQLPRQKNVIVDEICDTTKSKPTGSESASYSNKIKSSKDNTIPSTTELKMSERGASEVITKILPNSSANNILDPMTTKNTANKPSSSFTPATMVPQCTVILETISTTSKPTSTKISPADTKTKSSVPPATAFATTSSRPQITSSTLSTSNSLLRFTTKPSDVGAGIQSSATSTLSAASSVKPATVNVPLLTTQNVSTTSTSASCPSSVSLNLADKSISTSSTLTTSTVKPVPCPTSTAKPVPSPTSTVKPVPCPTSTAKPVPSPNSTAKPVLSSNNTAKPVPSITSTTKTVPSTTSTAKSVPSTTSTTKSVLSTTNTTKIVPSATSTAKTVPSTTSTAKTVPSTTSTAKTVPSTTSTAKPVPSTTSTTKPVLSATSTAKTMPFATSTAKTVPSTTTSTAKTIPSTTSTTKTVLSTSSAKSSTTSKKNGPKTNEVNKDNKGLKS